MDFWYWYTNTNCFSWYFKLKTWCLMLFHYIRPFSAPWIGSRVGNICFLSPLVLSKWEDLAFSVCIKVCLFFNFWMLKCTIMANKTQLWISSLKNWKKHNFLKKYKNQVLSPRELSFLSFEKSVSIFQFLNNRMHKCVKQSIIVHFSIQKLKNKHTFLKKHANWES